jgi:hypothetical protein
VAGHLKKFWRTEKINSQKTKVMAFTVTKTTDIKAAPDKVWEYVADLSRWAEWAIYNVHAVREGDNGYWLMDGPRGTSKVKMKSDKAFGILDHEFTDPSEGHWQVFARVIAGSDGAHFMITFTKPEQMPDEAFEIGMKLLDEELLKLKGNVEK